MSNIFHIHPQLLKPALSIMTYSISVQTSFLSQDYDNHLKLLPADDFLWQGPVLSATTLKILKRC